MSSAHSPSWDHSDDHLIHESDLALDIKYVKPIDAVFAFIPRGGSHSLVTAGTKRPAAVFG